MNTYDYLFLSQFTILSSTMLSHNLNRLSKRYSINKTKQLIVKCSMFEGEYSRETYMKKYRSKLNKSFEECIITPKIFGVMIKKHWANVGDVSLSVFLKDTQYHLDINMKDETYTEDTYNESIDEVLFQLNKWQIGQYTINVIDAYGTLMAVDKNKSVSIPLSVYVSRIDEFEFEFGLH